MNGISLVPGGNCPLESLSGKVVITHSSNNDIDVNLTAFILYEDGKVKGDSDMIYFNQPKHKSGVLTYRKPLQHLQVVEHSIEFDLSNSIDGISKIAICLTEDKGVGFTAVKDLKAVLQTQNQTIELTPNAFHSEKGVIVLDLYIRNDQWKARSVWQGFSTGLEGLCEMYGIEVEGQEPEKPVESQKSTINFEKVTGNVDLKKGDKPVIIAKSQCIIASVSWASGTDYDVYALAMTRSGEVIHIATFPAKGIPPLMNYNNGTVKHLGDINQHDGSTSRTEKLEIRLNDDIIAVLPVVYSAQSNGTGSFKRFKVSMSIDNQSGTKVTISADNANNNDRIYTCVPGLILNTPDGVAIKPLELYSRPDSENRPDLIKGYDNSIDILMDKGPRNAYK
jgi:tellurite resistance protein TerA